MEAPPVNGQHADRRVQTRPQMLDVTVRRQYVFAMRRTGATFDAIAAAAKRQFGDRINPRYNRGHAHRDVVWELERLRTEMAQDVEHVRMQELDRLDRMLMAMWPRALGSPADLERGIPPVPPDIGAQQMVLNIMQRRARYLPGLEAPVPIAPVTPDGEQPWHPGQGYTDQWGADVALALAQFGLLLPPGGPGGRDPDDVPPDDRPDA